MGIGCGVCKDSGWLMGMGYVYSGWLMGMGWVWGMGCVLYWVANGYGVGMGNDNTLQYHRHY